jgi:hypothetical protein
VERKTFVIRALAQIQSGLKRPSCLGQVAHLEIAEAQSSLTHQAGGAIAGFLANSGIGRGRFA